MAVRKILLGLIVACLPSAVATPAAAQSIPSPYRFVDTRQEAALFAGTSSMSTGRFGFGPGGGVNMGARWGIDLSGFLGFEAAAGVISGTRDIINPAKVVGDLKIGEGDQRIATADARLRLTLTGDRTWHRLQPIFFTGGGIAIGIGGDASLDEALASKDRFEFGTSFLGTVGTGVRYMVTDRLALRGDAIFSLWKIGTPPGFTESARGFTNVERNEWASGRHLSLSLGYRY